jgi:hypothetical protein
MNVLTTTSKLIGLEYTYSNTTKDCDERITILFTNSLKLQDYTMPSDLMDTPGSLKIQISTYLCTRTDMTLQEIMDVLFLAQFLHLL